MSTIHKIADTPPQFQDGIITWFFHQVAQKWDKGFPRMTQAECVANGYTHWTHSETRPIVVPEERPTVNPEQDAPTTPESWCKWRSMESAPKDGTRILVDGGEMCAVVAWMNVSSSRRRVMAWAIPESEGDEQGGFQTIDNPVAWLPIPTRPSAKEARK